MYPLIVSMIKKEPEHRPSMGDAMNALQENISRLSWFKLRARLRRRKDDAVINFFKDVWHAFRTIFYLIIFLPAIPVPPSTTKGMSRERGTLAKLFASVADGFRPPRTPPVPPV